MTDADWRSGHTRDELLAMVEYIQSRWDERQGWLFGAAVMRRIWDLLTDGRFRLLVEAAEERGCGLYTAADFDFFRDQLPRIANWRTTGVVNFRELPYWVQQTHYAAVALGDLDMRVALLSAVGARADHTAEHSSAEWKPVDDQIDAINRETDRYQREYDDAVWRGMSGAEQKGEMLTRRREQADVQLRELRAERQTIHTRIADAARTAEFAAQADLLRCIAGNPFRPVSFDPNWRTETVTSLARGIIAEQAFDRLPILADALEEAGCDDPDVLSHCRGTGPHAHGCWVLSEVGS